MQPAGLAGQACLAGLVGLAVQACLEDLAGLFGLALFECIYKVVLYGGRSRHDHLLELLCN